MGIIRRRRTSYGADNIPNFLDDIPEACDWLPGWPPLCRSILDRCIQTQKADAATPAIGEYREVLLPL